MPAGTLTDAAHASQRGDVLNIFSVDVEDWFHILELERVPSPDEWEGLESRVERNFLTLLDLFERHAVRVTCFFLGWVAERFPDLVREADRRGHEIASHGHLHQLIYGQSRDAFREDIRRARELLEDVSGRPVRGYRAPGFSVVDRTPWALSEVAAAGYTYDSSIFPASRGHGGLAGAPIAPHRVTTEGGELLELPVSVARVMGRRVCFFGGGYLRLFPYRLIEHMGRAVNAEGRPVIYYIHPREIDPRHPRLPMTRGRRFKSYVNLGTTLDKLDAILASQRLGSFGRWIELNGASVGAQAGPG